MNKFKILAHSILFVLFAVIISGCSSSSSSTSGGPSLQITPAAFDFGTVTVSNSAAPLEIILTNNGSEILNIASIVLSDPNNFSLDVNGGTDPCLSAAPALATGGTCTVTVRFTSVAPGTFPATLDITSNAPLKQLALTATGSGVNAFKVTINQVDISACPTVVAYVSVTDQVDFPATGLITNDFTITEGTIDVGTPTSSPIVDNVTASISIALVMDNSSSMQDTDIAEMNIAANNIVEQLAASDRVRIIKFDKNVYTVNSFTSNKSDLMAAIAVDNNGTGTALYDALQEAINSTDTQTTDRKAVIVITDGRDNESSTLITNMIANAKTRGIPVFVIAIGQSVDVAALTSIATDTSGEFYEADVAQNLRTIVQEQLTEVLFTDQYVLTYPSGISGGGTHSLKVSVLTSGGITGEHIRVDTESCP